MQLVHKLPNKKPIETFNVSFKFNNHRRLVFRQMEGYKILPFDQISYLEADSNYTKVIMKDGSCNLLSRTLKYVEEQLDNHFLRVHKSTVINLLEVESFNIKKSIITLFSGKHISVSIRKKAKVSDVFKLI